MPAGTVKRFNGRKGYGFIEPEDALVHVEYHADPNES